MAARRPSRSSTFTWAFLLLGLALRSTVTARHVQRPPAGLPVRSVQLNSGALTAGEQPAPWPGRIGPPGATRTLAVATAAQPPPPQEQPEEPGALANAITLPLPGAWISQFEESIANGSLVVVQVDIAVRLAGEWHSTLGSQEMLAA